jgi:serine/threonine protein kinase
MIGTMLGSRYELLEKIGEGGMAIVYKAKCHLLNRYVAVKILKEEFSNNIEFMEKFKREAASAASLSANNIVNIYDVGSERDINYIVMEYIKGKTLKQIILQNGGMNYNQAIDYGMQIAKALECAHKNNIIHRDIKPHNILVTEDGTVKVTDFGIAKASSSETITNTSTVMGSAHYFSPEQAKASFVDFRTDIYSFGIVLYEMVTGRVPYDAESPVSVALKHIQEPVVPPKHINGNIPENLNKLILKAIEKEPIKRYQTARDMLLDLQRIQNNSAYTITSNSMENEYTRIMEPVNVSDYEKEDDGKDSKPKINKKNKTTIIVSVAIILIIALGAVAGGILKSVFYPEIGGPIAKDKKVVPKIIGLDKSDAEKLVVGKGLIFTEARKENSEEPKGTVLDCFPDEGTEVQPNSEVRVTVSNGPESLKVPSVKGLDEISAKATLEGRGLEIGTITRDFHESIASGIVIDQDPSEDSSAQKGDKVNLVISKGVDVKRTNVPDLNGRSLNEAERLLLSKNLKLGDKNEIITNDKAQDGKISNQGITAGTEVNEGISVNVSYYKYEEPKIEQVKVPEFTTLTVKDAKKLAEESDVTIKIIGKSKDEDIIKTQDKKAGTMVDVGDTITLTIEAAVPPVTPPVTP